MLRHTSRLFRLLRRDGCGAVRQHSTDFNFSDHQPHHHSNVPPTAKLEEVSCTDGGSIVKVMWGDGTTSSFHGMWLRDSCMSAFDAGTGQRTGDSYKLIEGPGSRIVEVHTLDESHDSVLVSFADGHRSQFSGEWLRSHCFEDRKKMCSKAELWDRDSLKMTHVDWNDWIKNEPLANAAADPDSRHPNVNNRTFSLWTQELLKRGVAMISGAPTTAGTVATAARRVAYPRRTHYGEVFSVLNETNNAKHPPTHLANTPLGLALHSDLNYRESSPGIQMLHCIENNAKGGLSTFCDGFAAAERMRMHYPDEFALLTSVPIPFRLRGESVDHYYRVPSICTDSHGCLVEIHVNDRTRAPLELPASSVGVVYRALGLFHRLLEAEDLTVSLRLEPGDIVAFNNRRVLHGRQAFDPDSGPRRLEGCYIDYDEFLAVSRFLHMAVPPQVKAAPG